MQKILLFLCLTLLLSSASIDKKIKAKKQKLSSTKIEYNKMDKKLSTLAQKIINAKSQRNKVEKRITVLEKNIKENQTEFDSLKGKKSKVDDKLEALNQEIRIKKEKFLNLVADKFSMALVLEEIKKPTPESVMMQEAYGVYAKENKREITLIEEDIKRLKIKEEYFVNKQDNIKRVLTNYKKERQEYKDKKVEKTEIIKRLARDKAIYKKRFDRIRKEQRSLRKKLAKLKIIKHDKEIERQARSEVKQEEKKHKKHVSTGTGKTASYKGSKTISPLKGSRLIKKFGTYIDPIYKFKIFNKSITLKASYKGAKVKSVLKGKVVFAENSGGMLGRVVIIEHAKNIHTIYAKLSRLAPGIHVGKHVSKGGVIGKVDKSLMFEVTKNNKHMNPLKLIRL